MKTKNILLSIVAASVVFTGCGGGSSSGGGTTPPAGATDPRASVADCTSYTTPTNTTLTGSITTCTRLTAGQTWVLDGLVAVKGTTLKIDAGAVIAGKDGTGSSTSYMIIDKDAKIMAEGTAANPITFTSKKAVDGSAAAVGQWGGLTIIGNDTNSQVKPYEVNTAYGPGKFDN
ncbi:MAG TPA: hypothetical protein ENK82_00680, partial [Campylobacterales bacterium]|nr:hypothetical protein [Campylobacterales bacterium]